MTGPPRLRILFVIDKLHRAGAQVQLARLARSVDPAGFEASVCCLMRGGPLADDLVERGVPVQVLGLSTIYGPRALVALVGLARRMRAERTDVAHAFLVSSHVFATLAAGLARGPAVVTSRRDTGISRNWRLRLLEEWIINPLVDRVTANSDAVASAALRERGVDEGKLVRIPNGVDLDELDPARMRPEDVRREWGLETGDLLVGAVGHLSPVKGHAHLVEALARVRAGGIPARLLLVGDGPLRADLEARASTLGLARQVLFAGVREDAPRLMAAMDVVALPSRTEGMSNALLEAMALARPVVATDTGGNPELVEDGVTGRLVPVDAPEVLADAIGDLLTHPPLARRLGEAARRRIARDFPFSRTRAAHEALYRSLAPR